MRAIQNLYDENKELKQEFKEYRAQITNEGAISKLFGWFPFAQDMFRMEAVCKAVGYTIEQTARLLSGKSLLFSGSLYSEEHKRKFNTENSTAQIAQDSEAKKLHLVVDGRHIGEWFKQKYDDMSKSLSMSHETDKRRGFKL